MKKKERHLQWERENERRRVRKEELEKELHRQVVLKKGRKLPPKYPQAPKGPIPHTLQVLMKRRQEEALRERRMKELKEELVSSQRSLQAALLERDARKNQLVTKIKEDKVCSKPSKEWIHFSWEGVSTAREAEVGGREEGGVPEQVVEAEMPN